MCRRFAESGDTALKEFPRRTLAILLMAAACSVSALAQPAPPPNPDTWTLVGPTRTLWRSGGPWPETSGKIRSLAVDPSGTIYVGASGGGIWKRVGSYWVPLTDSQPSLETGAFAIDPSHPNTVYVGTGEVAGLSSYYGMGILKSMDAGSTWTHIIGPFLNVAENFPNGFGGQVGGGARIPALAVSPTDHNVLLAGVSIRLFDITDSGIYRSSDGGLNWTPVLAGNAGSSVLFDPTDGNIAYAGLGSNFSSPATGIYKSTDAGRTWSRLTGTPPNLLPTANLGQIRLAIARSTPLTLYAGISDNASLGHLLGLYKTTDGGVTWMRLRAAPDYCAPFCNDVNEVAVHPSNADRVLLGGSTQPVYRTLDAGGSWDEISGAVPNRLHSDVRAFAFSPDGNTVFVANDGGVASSTTFTSSSVTWIPMNDNLALTQFYGGFDVDPSLVDHAFVGSQDNGFQLFDGLLVWGIVVGGEGGNIVYDAHSNTAYRAGETLAWTALGYYGYASTRTGLSSTERVAALTPPIALDRTNPAIQYTGTNRVYKTTDSQMHWTAISPVLAGEYGFISAIAVGDIPLGGSPNMVCAGTSDGHVWCLRQDPSAGGAAATWIDYSAGLPNRYVTQIAIHKLDTVLVAFSGLSGLGADTLGHVFFSSHSGATWNDISGNLPNTPVNGVLIGNVDDGCFYVATDVGVFRTLDGGTTWAPLAMGLPRTVVTGLFLDQPSHQLYAGTMGRSMWRLLVPDLTGAPGPTISMNPWRMRFSAHFGGPNPPAQPLSVINAGSPRWGTTPLHWTATPITAFGGLWLAATPGFGIDTRTVSVAVDVSGLPVGLYNGIVRIKAPDSTNTPQDLTVMLAVTDDAPHASGGADVRMDASSPDGASMMLDGLGSSDPDKDPLTYSWVGPFGKATGPTPTVKIPIGSYAVTLTVADPAGLTSSATIKVTVFSAGQMTSNLIATVRKAGFQQAIKLLESALTHIRNGDRAAACETMRAFQNQILAQPAQKLGPKQAAQLNTSASHIIGALGCR